MSWRSLSDLLTELGDMPVDRVFLVPNGAAIPSAGQMAAAKLPAGWTAGQHHLDDRSPVWRFTSPAGRRLQVLSSAAWWGNEPATAAESAHAWRALGDEVSRVWRGGQLLSTPGATGLDLLRRSLPSSERFPTLSDEHQDMIRDFSGQGRIEPAGDGWGALAARVGPVLPRVEVWDARLAYAAVCWGLSAESAVHDSGSAWDTWQEGFARVGVTVPDGWGHLGLVGVREADGWRYPSRPGERFTTWLHGSEILLCRTWGWGVTVHERLTFARSGKPLQRFADRLVKCRESLTDRLVRAGLRAIMLHTIGRLHGRPPVIVHELPIDRADEVPDDAADVHMRDGAVRWTGRRQAAHDPAASHPEWSAAIWARARCRLLDAPAPKGHEGRTGALYLRPASVVALRTDAIWTTDSPRWPDDGRPGRYTLRNAIESPVSTPRSLAELLALAGDK